MLLLLLLACAVGRTSSDETEAHISVLDARNGFAGELYSLGQRLTESGNWQDAIRAMLGAAPPPLPPDFLDCDPTEATCAESLHVLSGGEACAGGWQRAALVRRPPSCSPGTFPLLTTPAAAILVPRTRVKDADEVVLGGAGAFSSCGRSKERARRGLPSGGALSSS